jgi:hypothetical protein
MEETMKRIVIITAALLMSVLSAQAAPHKAAHHPTHRQVASSSACVARQGSIADLISRFTNMPANQWLAGCMTSNYGGRSHHAGRSYGSGSAYDPGPSNDSGPSMDPSPSSSGPDPAGMNTSTNPTWPSLDQ